LPSTTTARSALLSTSSSSSSSSGSAETAPATTKTLQPIEIVSSMPEWLPKSDLKHHYYLLRHGQSTSNVQGVISSDRALAYSTVHGLTPVGITQAQQAAAPLLQLVQQGAEANGNAKNQRIVFVSSPFARAHQTAQACMDELLEVLAKQKDQNHGNDMNFCVSPDIILKDQLVERNFGRLDGQELFTYAYVWPLDKFNVTHTAFDAESVAAVCHRIRACIIGLEQELGKDNPNENIHVVLTSHADVLQITQLYAAQATNVGEFSSYRFTNGEVRRMTIGSTKDLPEPSPLPRPVRGTYIA